MAEKQDAAIPDMPVNQKNKGGRPKKREHVFAARDFQPNEDDAVPCIQIASLLIV